MKKYQIENVEHNYISLLVHNCCLVDYFKDSDTVLQLNYTSEFYANKDRQGTTIGVWRVKQQINNN